MFLKKEMEAVLIRTSSNKMLYKLYKALREISASLVFVTSYYCNAEDKVWAIVIDRGELCGQLVPTEAQLIVYGL